MCARMFVCVISVWAMQDCIYDLSHQGPPYFCTNPNSYLLLFALKSTGTITAPLMF